MKKIESIIPKIAQDKPECYFMVVIFRLHQVTRLKFETKLASIVMSINLDFRAILVKLFKAIISDESKVSL